MPAVPQAELLEWTAAADIGIIPYQPVDLNTRFCSPNKLFEYIAAGIPSSAMTCRFSARSSSAKVWGLSTPCPRRSRTLRPSPPAGSAEERETCRANVARAAKALNWEVEGAKLLGRYRRLMGQTVAPGC